MQMVEPKSTPKEYLKFAAVILSILIIAFLPVPSPITASFTPKFMGIFFIVFAAFKLADLKMFSYVFASYDLLAKKTRNYGLVYPFIELALGILYLLDIGGRGRDAFTAAILIFGGIGIFTKLRTKEIVACACLGKYIRLPLSTVSLTEDLGMGTMAIYMLII